jgi:hypothetical protein
MKKKWKGEENLDRILANWKYLKDSSPRSLWCLIIESTVTNIDGL